MMFWSGRVARGEHGSLAPATAAMIVMLFLLGGLIIDGARALGARARAASYAEEGARIAGQGVSFDEGNFDVDPEAVNDNAAGYCARIAANDKTVDDCSSAIENGEIVFTVNVTISKGVLGLATPGDGDMTFPGTGRAIAEFGIFEADSVSDNQLDLAPDFEDGNQIDLDLPEGVDEDGCPRGETWEEAPATFTPKPFRFLREDQVGNMPVHCPRPPVCANEGQLIPYFFHYYYPDKIRQHDRWEPLFIRCPVAEKLIYGPSPANPDCSNVDGTQRHPCGPIEAADCDTGQQGTQSPPCGPKPDPTDCDPDESGTQSPPCGPDPDKPGDCDPDTPTKNTPPCGPDPDPMKCDGTSDRQRPPCTPKPEETKTPAAEPAGASG
ncbi:MAG: hypothetical protein GEU96_02810 [Propionibacteriales bacterium]|nr:hypothetical protein [Propionibacteriales bacterium]